MVNPSLFSIKQVLKDSFKTVFTQIHLVATIFLTIIAVYLIINLFFAILYLLLTDKKIDQLFTFFYYNPSFDQIAYPFFSSPSSFIYSVEFNLRALLFFTNFFVAMIFELGGLRIALAIHDEGKSSIKPLFAISHLFSFFCATLFFYLSIFFGFIFFIIPAVIIAIKYGFYDLFIADTGATVGQSFKRSSHITQGAKWFLFKFELVLFLLRMAAELVIIAIPLIIPVIYYARASAYRLLVQRAELSMERPPLL